MRVRTLLKLNTILKRYIYCSDLLQAYTKNKITNKIDK